MKLTKLLAALALLFFATQAHAASLLPNGKQQFFATDGTLCVGCKVYFFIPETTTPKDTWTDSATTTLNTNPVVTDSYGSAIIYGIGTYRQILKDANGNTLWDTVTADQVSLSASWAGLSAGSPNAQTVTNANFSLTDGAQVNFLAGMTNTGATTLNVSGAGAITVVTDTSSGPQALGGGEITIGNVISVVYDATSGVFHIVTPVPIQSFNGSVFFNGVITPTILAADQNNWTPTGGFSGANTVRVSSNAAIKITGLSGGASGRTVIFHNIGSNAITFTQNSSLSNSGNRFLFPAPVNLRPNDDMTLQYDSLSAGWRMISYRSANPIPALYKNLKITNGVSPNTQMIGTADAFTLADANGIVVSRLSLSCTADLGVSGAGGLDAGSATNSTWYSYWFIYNPSTNTDSCLFSTSTATPTLPSGYTFYARAGWNRTVSGSAQFNGIIQYGNRAQYINGTAQTSALPLMGQGATGSFSAGGYTAVSTSSFVPPTASEIIISAAGAYGGGSLSTLAVAPNNTNYAAANGTNPSPIGTGDTTRNIFQGSIVLESTNIYWAAGASGGALICNGWKDNL